MSGRAVLKALVLRGSRNVFTVVPDTPLDTILECRIKGKILKNMEDYYNPLAPGDWVSIEEDPLHPGTALIIEAEERRNILSRFNQKGQKSQILAANIDLALCMTSPFSPPFRPRFLDRLLVQAEIANIMPVIVCNKWDLLEEDAEGNGADFHLRRRSAARCEIPEMEERLSDYRRIGYRVLCVSVKNGLGLKELCSLLAGKTSVLLGQSGVGKTSLVNAISPGIALKTGALNDKYDRGNHTTSLSVMLKLPFPGKVSYLVDTPGLRRMVPDGIKAEDLALYMKEFAGFHGNCTYGLSCSHRGEPGCEILKAAAGGLIHKDRYESFLRIGDELAAL